MVEKEVGEDEEEEMEDIPPPSDGSDGDDEEDEPPAQRRNIQEDFFPKEASSGEYRFYFGDDSNDGVGGANGGDFEEDSDAFRPRSPRD